MDPVLYPKEILEYSDEAAEAVASEIAFTCFMDSVDPDAAFESVSDLEFDEAKFDDFMAEYIANESISTEWGRMINYEKEIKIVGNAISKAAGEGINLLPGTDGFTTSAPRKKDGQYYTRATFVFSDGQAIRILFYNPDKPEEKHRYQSKIVSFQAFLNKKDITASLVKGGGKDYGPMKFGKIIGNLLKKNSDKFQKKNAEIRAQKAEMESIDKEMSQLDKQVADKSNEVKQSQERSVFLKKQHADWKEKSAEAATARTVAEERQKVIDESMEETEAGKSWMEGNYQKFEGKKYDSELSTKDVAKIVRGDIKKARTSGEILDAGGQTYSVRVDGNSINIHLKDIPEGVDLYSEKWKEAIRNDTQGSLMAMDQYSDVVKDTLSKIETMLKQYQKYEKDSMTDYFNFSFYDTVAVDYALKKRETERIKNEVDTGGEVETTESRDELKQLLINEYEQLRSGGDVPEFKMGIKVGKKKGDKAGKVTLDIKSADVKTREEFDDLKSKIEAIVSAHTDNYSISSDKAEASIPVIPSPEKIDEESEKPQGQVDLTPHIEQAGLTKSELNKISGLAGEFGTNPRVREAVARPASLTEAGPVDLLFDLADYASGKINSILTSREAIKDTRAGMEVLKKESWGGQKISDKIMGKFMQLLNMGYAASVAEPEPPPEEPQEQVEETGIKQTEIPPEEEPAKTTSGIGEDYKDRDGISKTVTHEIDGKKVSAIEERGYIISAYLRNEKWANLPTAQKTLVSEDDLKKAIDRSEAAYQTADDILAGKHDAAGYEKVDQLIDEVAEVIEDESKLMRLVDYLTNMLAKKFAPASA